MMYKYGIAIVLVIVMGGCNYSSSSVNNAVEIKKCHYGKDSSEVVNGLQLVLLSEVRPDGQPKLVIHFKNAGSEPFDIVEMGLLFLEVRDSPGYWRTFQHPRWDSSKIDTMFTFEPGHDESETEPVSAFATLPPGKYLVRVSMAFDRGMSQKYKSNRIWTGLLRSNTVEITVPKDEGDSPVP